MEEIWKDIEHFEGYYQVSNFARIRRIRPTIDCGIEVIRILKINSYKNQRYKVTSLTRPGLRQAYNVHVLVFDTFNPDKKGQKFKFKDGDSLNCRLDNLIPTKSNRKRVAPIKGKLNDITIQIKKFKKDGMSVKDIANTLECNVENVRYHINKK